MKTWLSSVSDAHYISALEQKYHELKTEEKEKMTCHHIPKKPSWFKSFIKAIVRMIVILFLHSGLPSHLPAQSKEPLEIKEAYIESFNTASIIKLSNHFGKQISKSKSNKLKKSLGRALKQTGKIESMTLENKSKDSFTYKVVHEKLSTLEVVFEIGQNGLLSAMSIGPYTHKDAPKLERNKTALILPFRGEWYTFWGGKTTSQNYHNSSPMMRGAYDFWVMGTNGLSHRNGATKNEDFYAFGKDIIAPADGKVFFVSESVKDNDWPAMNSEAAYGNVVMLETKNGEYIVFAHLKLNSIVVKKGKIIKQGDLLGQCGNSGNSTEPHLHFQVQNIPDFSSPTGAWTYFKKININGKAREDYMPVRRDKVSN